MIELKNIIPLNHSIPIIVVGAGGTGSHVLNALAVLNDNMIKLDFPGLDVMAMDFDTVSKTNVGRQAFTFDQVDQNKAVVLIDKINYEYGFNWTGIDQKFHLDSQFNSPHNGFLISCVDNVDARSCINHVYNTKRNLNDFPYWIDIGNGRDYGQVILGSVKYSVPTVFDVFPNLHKTNKMDGDESTGCSTLDAMMKQSLFINQIMAVYAVDMLKDFLYNSYLDYSMLFYNLTNKEINTKVSMDAITRLREIKKAFPALTFDNKGYEYIDKSKLSVEEKEAFYEVTKLCKEHISNFVEFNNFKDRKGGSFALRIQGFYDKSFIGVIYIPIDEF